MLIKRMHAQNDLTLRYLIHRLPMKLSKTLARGLKEGPTPQSVSKRPVRPQRDKRKGRPPVSAVRENWAAFTMCVCVRGGLTEP